MLQMVIEVDYQHNAVILFNGFLTVSSWCLQWVSPAVWREACFLLWWLTLLFKLRIVGRSAGLCGVLWWQCASRDKKAHSIKFLMGTLPKVLRHLNLFRIYVYILFYGFADTLMGKSQIYMLRFMVLLHKNSFMQLITNLKKQMDLSNLH